MSTVYDDLEQVTYTAFSALEKVAKVYKLESADLYLQAGREQIKILRATYEAQNANS